MEEALEPGLHREGLSDKTKGIVVGAAGAFALVGIVYAIVQEEKPKAKRSKLPQHATPAPEGTPVGPVGPPDKVPVYFPDGSYGYASFEEARQLGATTDGSGWDRRENFRLYGPKDQAEVEAVVTEDEDGRIKVTTILKDVSTVGMAVRGLAALEPVAEMLIALL